MSVHNSFQYKLSKKKAEEIHALLLDLDKAADLLYNRLEVPEVWDLIQNLEDVRVKYYTLYYEYNNIIELKGKINGKKD